MPGHGIYGNSRGIVRRLPQEVARFLNSQEWLFGGSADDKPCVFKRRLRIEPLESRHLMAVGASSLVDPLWFQNVAGGDGPAHAGTADWTTESVASSTGQDTAAHAGLQNVYDWIVQFNTASLGGISSVAQTASLLVGGGVEFQVLEGLGLSGMVLVRSSGASLDAARANLGTNLNVASFERDAVDQVSAVPSDPQYNQLWGMSAIDAPQAWNISTGSSGVVVAVLDTGVDYNHRDLAANIWTNPGEIPGNGIDDDHDGFVDDVHGYDFVNNDGDPMDDNSHGTHVSGTIAAVANNGQGVAGVNWSSSIMALKFLNADGTGYLSDAVRAVNYATMMRTQYGVNVRVMSNSWGGGEYSSSLDSAIRASSAADILFVAAAGNSGTNNDSTPQYPANYTAANVISVAAVDKNDCLASFSCYGASTVDIGAPGVSIYSTIPGNRYAFYSGTSMATPFVAGVAALAWAVDPDASVADVRHAILAGADHVAGLSGKVASGGVLNAHTTLTLLDAHAPSGPSIGSLVASPGSVVVGASVTLNAGGIAASTGTVTGVSFYADSNNNGQYDAADQLLGSTGAIAGGQAAITIDSALLGAGVHRILARAQDSSSVWSSCVSTTLTVVGGDDHGNDAAPVLAQIGNQTLPYSATTLAVPVHASDADGDSLTYTAQAMAVDPLAERAYTLDRQLGLHTYAGRSYHYNAHGVGEKYLLGNNNTLYFLRPSGALYRWGGSIAKSAYIDILSPSYYANPALLYAAHVPSLTSISSASVGMSIVGETLIVTRAAGFSGVLHVQVTVSDGQKSDSQTFTIADPLARKAYNIDQRLGLHAFANGSYSRNARGAGEKYILGTNSTLYFLRPNGSLYLWGGSIAASRLVARLSPAYYANPALLHNAQSPTFAAAANSAAARAIQDDAAQYSGGAAAEASLESVNVAMAWLAVEDSGGRLDAATSGGALASVAAASSLPAVDLTASLHDQVLALLSPGDSPTRQEGPTAAFDARFGPIVAANWADTDAERRDAVDFVFEMPMEKFSPLGELLS